MIRHQGVSLEVMTEEFYDAAAFLRDLDLPDFPTRVPFVAAIIDYPGVYEDDETGEEQDVFIRGELQRRPDGSLHMHMMGVCCDIDPALLEQKRPRP